MPACVVANRLESPSIPFHTIKGWPVTSVINAGRSDDPVPGICCCGDHGWVIGRIECSEEEARVAVNTFPYQRWGRGHGYRGRV